MLITSALFAYQINIHPGWQLLGAKENINPEVFNNPSIDAVWAYDDSKNMWRVDFPNKPQIMDTLQYIFNLERLHSLHDGEGYWVLANSAVILDTDTMLWKMFVDTPQDFSLQDIAQKDFQLFFAPEDTFIHVTFDDKGYATIAETNITAKLHNGIIDFIDTETNTSIAYAKKLAYDENGFISLTVIKKPHPLFFSGYDYPMGQYRPFILQAWLATEPNPVDMQTLLPYKIYYWNYPGYEIYETNGTIERFRYDYQINTYINDSYEQNFTIENGKIIIHYNSDEYNLTIFAKESSFGMVQFQKIKDIGRYNIEYVEEIEKDIISSPLLEQKSWNDFIDSNLSMQIGLDFSLKSNGYVIFNSDDFGEYSIKENNLTITRYSCSEYDEYTDECISYNEYNNTYQLDSANSQIIRNQYKGHFIDITSSTPIINPRANPYYNYYYRKNSSPRRFIPHRR